MKRVLPLYLAGLLTLPLAAQHADLLRDKGMAQEKARAMAAQLVTGLLDIQLRQLEENGLQDREIYRDIRTMRNNIDELVAQEMKEVVARLVVAQEGSDEERLAKFQAARPAMRKVVVGLMAERQRLQRRLKSARLAAEVRRLLEQQTSVHQWTAEAAELPDGVRQQRTLQLSEDQKDVAALYYQLLSLLGEMRSWSGPLGIASSRGLTLLQTAKTEQDLKRAAATLQSADFQDALDSQRRVARALRALLEQIDAARGMVSADRAALLQQIDQLLDQQEAARARTLTVDLERAEDRDPLEDEQREIHRKLGDLSDAAQAVVHADPLLMEQAKQAALRSIDALFEGDSDEAASQQSRVIGSLAQLRRQLLEASGADRSDRSSDELLAEQQQLDQAAQRLEAADGKQSDAEALLKQDSPAAAAARQQEASQLLENAAEQLAPSVVQARLKEAAAAASEASKQLEKSPLDGAANQKSFNNAREALEAAKGELAVRRADVERHRLAVEVGELARAAEALERTAAAQREARRLVQESRQRPLSPQESDPLAEQQPRVRIIAKEISDGVLRTAPNAGEELSAAEAQSRRAEKPLREMTEGLSSKESETVAASALGESALHLEQAAAEIRKQQGATAEQLSNVAGKQLSQIGPTRAGAEDALRQAEAVASPEDAILRALDEVEQAVDEQLRADGRAAMATAREADRQVQALLVEQAAAQQAIKQFAQGPSQLAPGSCFPPTTNCRSRCDDRRSIEGISRTGGNRGAIESGGASR